MNMELTDSSYWAKYWKNKSSVDKSVIGRDFLFHDVLEKYVPRREGMNFLELGGYPGMWAIYFAKYWFAKATLLDRYIDHNVIQALSLKNKVDNIGVVEGDVFQLTPVSKFDVVLSAGFIEHFSDVSRVVDTHIQYLKPGGTLILTVPNFLGLNGLFQKILDRETYDTHFLYSMHDKRLKKLILSKNLDIKYISYYGKFGVWLEDINSKPRWLRRLIYILNIIGKFLFRIETRLFSPYLVMVAKNSSPN